MHGRLLALIVVLATTAGCATKRDLRDLRDEMSSMRVAQEALLRDLQRQNATILDSMSTQDVRLRGDLTNQLLQMDRQLVQIQELTGQGQQQLSQLRETVRMREEAFRNETGTQGAGQAGDPEELFTASQSAMQRGSLTTARSGFQEFVRAFPQHPRAPDAHLAIGESYEQGNQPVPALEAYARLLELHPNSTRAPTALLRAAKIELARNNRDTARTMLTQITSAYPRSAEAAEATRELQRLRR
ncbi:MAG: outer membrane protein assembly factor BamD [Gemmatimonadetes bacterium]|nr:outer membrane protein assembly factor BamD [Gemmatimonadota bacterium]